MAAATGPAQPAWTGRDPGPAPGDDLPVDGVWRVWERLRSWDLRYALAVDTTLALGLFLVCTGWFVFSHVAARDLWFVGALTLPLMARRRAPVPVFLIVSVVALVQWATITRPLVADAALLVSLFTVTAESEWIAVVVAALIVEIGVILATARWSPIGNYTKSLIFLTGMAVAALLAGVVVRALRTQMSWLVERAHRLEIERDQQSFLAAAAERARIAREMHDVVSHNIQVMVTLADAAAVAQRSDPRRAGEAMAEVSGTGRQALRDMRRLLGLLREGSPPNPAAAAAGASPGEGSPASLAPQPGLDDLHALIDRVRATGLDVQVTRQGAPFTLSDAAALTVYRIVQEALTNTMKHAPAARLVEVWLTFEDPDVSLRITDDGAPAPALVTAPSSHRAGGGHGLEGMVERAAAFGGSLTAGPGEGGGWLVTTVLRGCAAPHT
jgi:signal transduction histidine kinase